MTFSDASGSEVLLYWRPGCRYCSDLERRLHQLGVVATEVNIWADPDAAAALRAVAGVRPAVPVLAPWLVVIASVAASFALDAYGYSRISWALDVVAVAAYVAVRRLQRSALAFRSLSDRVL